MFDSTFLKHLKWDSEFWGVNFYELIGNGVPNSTDIQIPFVIQRKVFKNDLDVIQFLKSNDYVCVEQKITLVKPIRETHHSIEGIQPIQLSDIENLKAEIGSIFVENSRYRMLDHHKVKDFYYRWLSNSCHGIMDTYVDGYFIHQKLAGFISYRVVDRVLVIGLFGVLSPFQGKGVASVLLNHIENVAQKMKLLNVSVSTQASNQHALKAYTKNGFLISEEEEWYYKINLNRGEQE